MKNIKNIKNIITVLVFSIFLFSLSAMCYFDSDLQYTESERRELAQLPVVSSQSILSGKFMADFENYSADQFPYRDGFRSVKAIFSNAALRKKDNNGLFFADGHLSKISTKKNSAMMDYAANLFKKIIDKNINDEKSKVYFSVVPDKNYYLAEKNGFPSLDYGSFIDEMKNKTDYMTYIDLTEKLSLDDYYRTDSHWKQENITKVAEHLGKSMGVDVSAEYKTNILFQPFRGVYAGQSALPVEPDVIKYLTSDTLDNCTVTYYDTGKPINKELYDMKKAFGKDPYEMFLSGSSPLVVIENPYAATERKLIMFRDSFGASLAPLMVEGYKEVTVVDVRYVQSSYLGNFVDFDNSDVLFIYSTELLNNSLAMK